MEKKILENKTIKVRSIVRPRPFLRKGHDGEFMYTGCRRIYGLPFDSKKRSFFNPFKDEEEQELFEKALNQKEGSLNLYDSKSKFWGSFTFSLDKDGIDLHLGSPNDALIYRIMLVHPKFANSESEKGVPECEYIIIDQDIEEQVISEKAEVKDKAMDFMYKIKKSKKKMYETLRLLGKKADPEASVDWLKTELYKILDQSGNTPGIVGIKQFIEVMEDPTSDVKIFVLEAIDKGDITQRNDGYRILGSNKFLGKDIKNVYEYFASETPDAKEDKLIIEQRINNQ
jgi:hypothetical protein